MKTRIINTKIWTDPYFLGLDYQERYLFIYYLINSRVNIIHLYECPDVISEVETGLPIGTISKIKAKLNQDEKIMFYKSYVYLKNAYKYELFSGEKNEKAKKKLFSELSKDTLDWYSKIVNTPINTPLIPSIIHNSENITNKTEKAYERMNEIVNPEDIPI